MSKLVVSINKIETEQDLAAAEQVIQDIHTMRTSRQGFFSEVYVVVTVGELSLAGYGVLRSMIESLQGQGEMVHAMITQRIVDESVLMAVVDADVLSISQYTMLDLSLGSLSVVDTEHHPEFQQSLYETGQVALDGTTLASMLNEQLFTFESGKELKTMMCVPTFFSTMVESYRNIVSHYNVGAMDAEDISFYDFKTSEMKELIEFTDEIEQRLQA